MCEHKVCATAVHLPQNEMPRRARHTPQPSWLHAQHTSCYFMLQAAMSSVDRVGDWGIIKMIGSRWTGAYRVPHTV